eukprot:CAMPEP_0172717290 /NCGR_PEP_ID=MMETSP1074-20121228/70954_1 /TAXON_ID=2916 /ORGANISM="Ceratium fusus, Strain PA161109" /LENGTH=126 /DNA_ID=CAMNT_0013542191 /DNA_START=125 /DNA_END=505 /DNA_ORIENTATION=-
MTNLTSPSQQQLQLESRPHHGWDSMAPTAAVYAGYNGIRPNYPGMILHCAIAMLFTALALMHLHRFGSFLRSYRCCPEDGGYSSCEMWQDLRTMSSFVSGSLVCSALTRARRSGAADNVRLYTYML